MKTIFLILLALISASLMAILISSITDDSHPADRATAMFERSIMSDKPYPAFRVRNFES